MAQNVDVNSASYTVQGGKKPITVAASGVSILRLLQIADPGDTSIKFLAIRRTVDDSLAYVTPDDLTKPPANGQGPPVFFVDSDTTRFLRPARNSKDPNAADDIATTSNKQIVVYAYTGTLLKVKASASPGTTHAGQNVSFSASVTNPPKDEHLTYTWIFGDGVHGDGATASHAFARGVYNVFVTVKGDKGSFGSSDSIHITVGKPVPSNSSRSGGGNAGSHAPSSGSTSGGGGGSSTPSRTPPVVNTPQLPPKPITSIPKVEPGTFTVSGILLASSRQVSIGSLLRSPGSPAARAGSTPHRELPITGAAAVALLGLGAFLEGGRRVRIPKPWRR
jgi:hypothetical protein